MLQKFSNKNFDQNSLIKHKKEYKSNKIFQLKKYYALKKY